MYQFTHIIHSKLNTLGVCLLLMLAATGSFAELDTTMLIDIRIQNNTAADSWLEGGLGPFRGDKDSSKAQLGQAILFSKWRISDRLALRGQLSVYNDMSEKALGVGELYAKYKRPFARVYQLDAKVGAFFPDLSVENTQPGWTTHTLLSNSAINTWIGEELKIIGFEAKVSRIVEFDKQRWRFGTAVNVFQNNDTTGALLAWRGFALHDRQVRLGERIRLAELPSIGRPGGFIDQSAYTKPFVEVDGNTGYMASLSAEQAGGLSAKFHRYDNQADPDALENGQYAWHTQFSHLGVEWPITSSFKLASQWLSGSSEMGFPAAGQVNIDFESWFIHLQKTLKAYTFALRFENFDIQDLDNMPNDDNRQDGRAWTVGARVDLSDVLSLQSEFVMTDIFNAARSSLPSDAGPQNANSDAHIFQISAQWRL